LNDESRNILTVEDPIEYTLDGVNQVQTKDEIGMDFSLALKSFLRQDPDVIMVGEVRDSETAQIAVRSSLTGHLVLSTLHTNDALGCVSRLKEMGVSSYLLADTLKLLVAQRLIRILCPKCKREYVYKDRVRLFRAVGCEECYYTGYKGRKALYEVIPFTDELAEKVRNNTSLLHDDIDKMGVVTLEESAVKLLKEGLTSVEEVSSFINIDIHDF
jgi:general secretion pathway protein E/type IV pilus assembly protein PilB